MTDVDFDAPMAPSARLALLQEHFPRYEVWAVPSALSGAMTWCARLRGDKVTNVIHADRASHLAELIKQVNKERAAKSAKPPER